MLGFSQALSRLGKVRHAREKEELWKGKQGTGSSGVSVGQQCK